MGNLSGRELTPFQKYVKFEYPIYKTIDSECARERDRYFEMACGVQWPCEDKFEKYRRIL
jgi:hypothetical protein